MASCRSRRLAPTSRFKVAKACRIECRDRLPARSAGSPAARPRRRSRARTSARYIRAPVPVANSTRRAAAAAPPGMAATPVLAVGAAVMFLHAVPAGGSDLALEAAGVAGGAAMGAIGGLATRLRLGADGLPLGRADILAAGMWIGGVGARLAFAIAAGNGAGPAIARFSVAHHITGSSAWVAALVLMALADVLTRLVVIYLHGRRLAADPAASAAAVPVGARA